MLFDLKGVFIKCIFLSDLKWVFIKGFKGVFVGKLVETQRQSFQTKGIFKRLFTDNFEGVFIGNLERSIKAFFRCLEVSLYMRLKLSRYKRSEGCHLTWIVFIKGIFIWPEGSLYKGLQGSLCRKSRGSLKAIFYTTLGMGGDPLQATKTELLWRIWRLAIWPEGNLYKNHFLADLKPKAL